MVRRGSGVRVPSPARPPHPLHYRSEIRAGFGASGGSPCVMRSPLPALPSWGNACGDGRIGGGLEDFESSSGFAVFKAHASIPDPTLATVAGCRVQALAFGYDLRNTSPVDGQSWIVLQRSFPVVDLRSFTHLRLAVRGSCGCPQ